MAKVWKEYNRLSGATLKSLMPLNELSGSDWTRLSRSVNTFNGTMAEKRKIIGAAFPISLAKHFISIYTREGDTVLDPFAGVGTTLDAAQLLGRHAVGFEIVTKFAKLARTGIAEVDRSDNDFRGEVEIGLFQESCLNLRHRVSPDSIDLILTSPPYCNLLNKTLGIFTGLKYPTNIYHGRPLAKPYSSNQTDFGNMEWGEYCKNIEILMQYLFKVSREGSYNVWVVRDFRDMPEHVPYVNLHGKIIELAQAAGWILTDIMIWDQTNQRQLVKLGGPRTRRFYFNIGHSFAVVFRKNVECEKFRNLL